MDPNFLTFVTNALATAQLIRCVDPGCIACSSPGQNVVELAHYSRDMIEEWEEGRISNQLCWTDRIGHRDSDLTLITDQPGRKYQLLCLIKFASQCPRLVLHKEFGKCVNHFRIAFPVPKSHMVRIKLDFNNSNCDYTCNSIL